MQPYLRPSCRKVIVKEILNSKWLYLQNEVLFSNQSCVILKLKQILKFALEFSTHVCNLEDTDSTLARKKPRGRAAKYLESDFPFNRIYLILMMWTRTECFSTRWIFRTVVPAWCMKIPRDYCNPNGMMLLEWSKKKFNLYRPTRA
jgi:hypothetical protein